MYTVEQLSMALGEKENEVIVAKRKQAGSVKVQSASIAPIYLVIVMM